MAKLTTSELADDNWRVKANEAVTHSDGIPTVNGTIVEADAQSTDILKPLPVSYYSEFLSDAAKERRPSPIRGLFPLENKDGLVSFLAGKPNPTTFPITSLSFNVRSPTGGPEETLHVQGSDLSEALQYGPTAGAPRLIEWIYGLQDCFHGRRKGEKWQLSIGLGSNDVLYKAFSALCNPEDTVLVESPVYAAIIPVLDSLHCEQIEVETDGHGISVASLKSILESWPTHKKKPRLLYTVPYGCNPSGQTADVSTRREVLKLAKEHDFIIFEDDPYFFLYYGEAPRPPSYFSLEKEMPNVGRVVRFDSLSKVLSAGIRIGFISGPETIVQAIDFHTASSNLQVASLTQVIAFQLLNSWGYDGFKAHTADVAAFYKRKRDVFEQAMHRHLDGLVEWVTPEAGMFIWFKLRTTPHAEGDGDSEELIRTKAYEEGVLALPGTVFLPDGRKTAYVRASFSLSTPEEVDEGLKRLRKVILAERASSEES